MLRRTRKKLKSALISTPLFRLISPRKTHIYCVGTAKSGTHSIAAIFGNMLRSSHEPENKVFIDLILDRAASRINHGELRDYLLKRDQRLWLDVDSSQLNFFLLDIFVELFSDAKFILTIRNPYTWLDSFINDQLARSSNDRWNKLRDLRFKPDVYSHSQEELSLKEKGLYTLDGYLSYWALHNRTVIDTVSNDKLLIVRTDKISESADEVTCFAGIAKSSFKQEKSHAYKAKEKFHLLHGIEQDYLEDKVKEHCGDLMDDFFPEVKSLNNALPKKT